MNKRIISIASLSLASLLLSPAQHAADLTTIRTTDLTIKPILIDPVIVLIAPKINPVYVQKWGKDTYNCGSKTRPCLTINQGVYRVASTTSPYSTSSVSKIYVGPGKYTENVSINKNGIRITSTHGTDSTIIKASNTQHDAVYIASDGVYFGKKGKGFTLTGSVDSSGLFSTGSYGQVMGNKAINNGARGFQFGNSTIAIGAAIPNEPLAGGAPAEPLINQTNVTVYYNIAEGNGEGGFYFSDFDNSTVKYNEAHNNLQTSGAFFGFGSGFWIDMNSNNDRFEYNIATGNDMSGFFYRRFGVTDQIARYNQSSENLSHGFMLMGDVLTINRNTATNNAEDGFHFMGYDQVVEFGYNTAVGNIGTGVTVSTEMVAGMSSFNNFHHNNLINNDSIANPGHNNCGLTNDFKYDGVIGNNNFWGNMYTPGPGTDPADDVCGFFSLLTTPASTMN